MYYFQYYLDNRIDAPGKGDRKIILVPLGAKNPEVFQKKWSIENAVYTNNLNDVYSVPGM
jgi:hypothetical protein